MPFPGRYSSKAPQLGRTQVHIIVIALEPHLAVQRPIRFREQRSPHALPPTRFYLCLYCFGPSLSPCRCTIAVLECSCAALAGSTLGHSATRPSPSDPIDSGLGVAIRSPPAKSVSIIDRDCGTSHMSPPARDLEAQLRISQPPKISCRGATSHSLCFGQSLESPSRLPHYKQTSTNIGIDEALHHTGRMLISSSESLATLECPQAFVS